MKSDELLVLAYFPGNKDGEMTDAEVKHLLDVLSGKVEYSDLDSDDIGPCYDLCACRHCWNGWTTFSFWQRLKWRLAEIWRSRSFK